MIKIIKRGTKQITSCAECGCEFSYEKEDVITDQLPYVTARAKEYVNCPQCGSVVILSKTK